MSFRQTLLMSAIVTLACAAPAAAQFGTIFGDQPPPRPPAAVPDRPPGPPPNPPTQFPQGQQQVPQQSPQLRPFPQPAQTNLPQPQGAPGAIQSQPLPPPPGATAAPAQPAAQPPASAAVPGLPPGQRQPRGTAQPADTTPQPGDEVIAEPPAQKIPNATAVFAGLDKITGRIIAFDAAIGETVQFGALQVTPRACYTRPPTEPANTDGFIEVDELTLQGQIRRIFTGWMFSASPGLNAVEHPIYDVWLTDCKSPTVAAAAPAEAAPARPAQRPSAPAQRNPTPAAPSPNATAGPGLSPAPRR